MYTPTSGRHAATSRTTALGSLSYLGLQVYGRQSPTVMTSSSCRSLGASTFAHVPPANIIFSFNTYKITRKETVDDEGTKITLLTLDKAAKKVFDTVEGKRTEIVAIVKEVKKQLRAKGQDDDDE